MGPQAVHFLTFRQWDLCGVGKGNGFCHRQPEVLVWEVCWRRLQCPESQGRGLH